MSLLIALVHNTIPEILGAMHIPKKESKEKMNLKVEIFIAPAIALLRIVAWTYHTHFFLLRMLDFWKSCCSQSIPKVFLVCSHQVPNELLTHFSSAQCVHNVTSLCPICFALCFALGTYIDLWINKCPPL